MLEGPAVFHLNSYRMRNMKSYFKFHLQMEMKQNEMKSICAPTPVAREQQKRPAKHHPLSGNPRTPDSGLQSPGSVLRTFARTLHPEPWPKCRIRGER